jgi:hypothetical protein
MSDLAIVHLLISSAMSGSDTSQAHTEQTDILSRLDAQPKALQANAEQACASTDEGRVTPSSGSGNRTIDLDALKISAPQGRNLH